MSPCTHCGRPAWKATGGMGGGIMPDDETHCLQRLGRSCRIAHEGYMAGLRMARSMSPDTLDVIAEALAAHLAEERMWEGRRDYRITDAQAAIDDFERWRSTLGDEAAIAIRGER